MIPRTTAVLFAAALTIQAASPLLAAEPSRKAEPAAAEPVKSEPAAASADARQQPITMDVRVDVRARPEKSKKARLANAFWFVVAEKVAAAH